MQYAELVCQSNFSFLHGASHPEDLVARAHALGYQALAITDEASVSGAVRAHLAAQALGFKVIHGARFRIHATLDLVVLVQNREGWRQLCRLITLARRQADKGDYRLSPEQLEDQSLPGCLLIWLPNPLGPEADLHRTGRWLQSHWADRVFIGCSLHLRADDKAWADQLVALGALLSLRVTAVGQVLMHRRRDKPLADLLTAIRLTTPLSACGRRLSANAEQYLRPRLRLAQLYRAEMLATSLAIADQCQFSLDELRYEYPDEIVPPGLTPTQWLRHLTEEGARRRFPPDQYPQGLPPAVRQQIEHELALIHDLQYEPYFLTVYDIVAFARSRNILCQGRGSAANSAVCYCLGITEVDPSRMSMLFERFISKERNEPPDIDVDFEHQRREEVIQYLYDKYGRDRAALTAALIRYRPRSALRDVGKALGLDPLLVDQAAKGHQWWDGKQIHAAGLHQSLQEALERLAALGTPATALPSLPSEEMLGRWAHLASQLMGFPRHLSQHVGGFVIARHLLSDLVPIENAAMAERSIIQWDKDDIDALGLLKVDVLALGMLSAIRRALEFVGEKNRSAIALPMQDIPSEDPETYAMISAADTIGVFQIESRAQMSMLPRLKPQCFYDLVIEVAIVRPGPIQGGMVHPYLRRRQGLEPVDYPSPGVRQALERTLGVPIFQEQVMQLAILAAGFTAGEADQLRRAMAAWRRRGSLGPFHEKLVNGMLMRGYTRDFAERVFAQIQGFGEYGFPESHAASFALLVYVSCWIKRHHPDAFLAGLLNAQPLGFYAPAQLVRDARAHGVAVLPVCVQKSAVESRLEAPDGMSVVSGLVSRPDKQEVAGQTLWPVRLGLNRVAQLSEAGMQRLVAARSSTGPFASVEDLARRAALARTDLQALAAAGALSGLAGDRHQASWQAAGHEPLRHVLRDSAFEEPALQEGLLPKPSTAQDLLADYASLGLTLGQHPVSLIRPLLSARFKSQTATHLRSLGQNQLARATGLVTHRQRPGTAKGTVFITLEDETGSVNLIVWPDVFLKYRQAALHAQLLTAYGRWQRDAHIAPEDPGQVMHLLVLRLEDHTPLLAQTLGQLATASRDFH
ncbi:MAG: error-prone DNA polymerase [Burkholderiaceae bacterium]